MQFVFMMVTFCPVEHISESGDLEIQDARLGELGVGKKVWQVHKLHGTALMRNNVLVCVASARFAHATASRACVYASLYTQISVYIYIFVSMYMDIHACII